MALAHDDRFSMSTMLNSLPRLRIPAVEETKIMENQPISPRVAAKETKIVENPAISSRGISASVPPPGFAPRKETVIAAENQSSINLSRFGYYAASTPQELEIFIFNLMTSEEGSMAEFKEMISKLNRGELQTMASFLTSDSKYFMEIARKKYGSKRLQLLLGKSYDVDRYFSIAILHQFFQILTDKYATYVAIRAMSVFHPENKEYMYVLTLHYALDLARDQQGCIALNEIITDLDDPFYRSELLDVVARNALFLSADDSGNFVVQHALKLKDFRCTHNIAISLRGYCVDLSLRKYGSYIVELLLEAEESMVVVVEEFLECEGDRLIRLARSEYGNYVMSKALRVTHEEMTRVPYLFWGLVHKLMPFRHLLRKTRGCNIAAILDSIS